MASHSSSLLVGILGVELLKDRLFWIGIGSSLFFFGLGILGLVGELLGWWNDLGEVLMSWGPIIGFLLALITAFTGATRRQVALVATAVGAGNRKLDAIGGGVAEGNTKLDAIGSGVQGLREDLGAQWDRQMLAIDRAFDEEEEQTALLEEQTALERQQSTLLAEIRDRLPPRP